MRSTRAAGWAFFEAKLVGGGRVTANVIRLKSLAINTLYKLDGPSPAYRTRT
jgi:hypothetical protein